MFDFRHFFTLLLQILPCTLACTNLLVTPGASEEGDTMIAYNADSGSLMGLLYHYPAQKFNSSDNTIRKVWNWDTGVYLGEIPESEINETYNVIGNTNEYGLVIAETTFGGIDILANPIHQPNAKIDYGSLIWITLQRCKNAREAIHLMTKLMDTYGYASEGESFSIGDRNGEVWIMEVIGRGKGKVGSVWVARRIPDGYISAHSNQARIQTFPRDDPETCLYSHDVIDLAKEIGIYETNEDEDPNDLQFSFSDVYNPISFFGARLSDARTWSIFSMLSEDETFQKTYEDYALGKDTTVETRMPLWIKPKKKLSYEDVAIAMSNHYEGSKMSFNQDVGAGQYEAPYRPRPLTWKFDDKLYHNERSVATQQTGWNFIAQIRSNMPAPISSILWFAVDDSSTSPRFPVYGGSTEVSLAFYGKGTQDGFPSNLLDFDLGKAFWVQNMVSNLAYSRWNLMYPLVRDKIDAIYQSFKDEVYYLDQQMVAVYNNEGINEMVNMATKFSVQSGDRVHKEWFEFYGDLFARFRDFFVIEKDPYDPVCNCVVKEVGFSDAWKQKIIDDTGYHYECMNDESTQSSMERYFRGSNDKFSIMKE